MGSGPYWLHQEVVTSVTLLPEVSVVSQEPLIHVDGLPELKSLLGYECKAFSFFYCSVQLSFCLLDNVWIVFSAVDTENPCSSLH